MVVGSLCLNNTWLYEAHSSLNFSTPLRATSLTYKHQKVHHIHINIPLYLQISTIISILRAIDSRHINSYTWKICSPQWSNLRSYIHTTIVGHVVECGSIPNKIYTPNLTHFIPTPTLWPKFSNKNECLNFHFVFTHSTHNYLVFKHRITILPPYKPNIALTLSIFT